MRLLGLFSAILLPIAANAQAVEPQTLRWSCDTPANRFSAIDTAFANEVEITGTVRAVEYRRDEYLPMAGARIENEDGSKSVGFQLSTESRRPKFLDVYFYMDDGSGMRKGKVGELPADQIHSFVLRLSEAGSVSITVGEHKLAAAFTQVEIGKARLLCSSGEFEFKEARFSTSPA